MYIDFGLHDYMKEIQRSLCVQKWWHDPNYIEKVSNDINCTVSFLNQQMTTKTVSENLGCHPINTHWDDFKDGG